MIHPKEIYSALTKDSNDKTVIKNIILAFLIKGGALIVQILTLPAYLRFFSNQTALGVWYTLLSIVSWIFTFDLGIGNGLRNKLVSSLVKGDKEQIRKDISSSYISITALSLLLCVVCITISYFLDWNNLLNIGSEIIASSSLQIAITITLLGVFVQFVLKTISSVLYSLQFSSVNNLLALITSVGQLVFVVLLPSKDVGTNFITMAIIHAACVNVPLILTTFILFSKEPLKGCAPCLRSFSLPVAKEVLKIGGVFLWAQIMFMFLTSTNEYLITYLTTPENVVTYQIYNKIFTQIGSLCALALTPMWSAITKAMHEGNYQWMKKSYERLHKLIICAVALEIIVLAVLQPLINLWLSEDAIQVNYGYAFAFALYGCVYIWQTVESTIVCGTGRMKLQMISYTIGVFVKLLLSIILVKATGDWIHIVTISAAVLLVYCMVQTIQTERSFKVLKK